MVRGEVRAKCLLVLLCAIVIGGILLSLFDGKSVAEGQYLAFITASTIGYGNISPEIWPARIVGCLIGINGVILTGVTVALTVKGLALAFREELDSLSGKPNAEKSGQEELTSKSHRNE